MSLSRFSVAAGAMLLAPVAAAAQGAPPSTTGADKRPGGFVTVPTTPSIAPLKPIETARGAAVGPRLRTAIIGPDDYPAASIVAGEQGRVTVSITISAEGAPTECGLVQSSGFPALDAHTCALVMQRARFDPARDEKGDAVRSIVKAPFLWQIPAE